MRQGSRIIHLSAVANGRLFFTRTAPLRLEQSADELAREEELRQKVQQRYKGMQIPRVTNHEYGHFSTMGINESAAQQAAGDAGSQGFGAFGGQPFQNRGKVDWIMLLTGCALVYFSGKILFNQITRGVNEFEMPLWTASVNTQAQHLLFAVQFNRHEQEQLKKEFEGIRQTNPFANFYDFVRSRRPEFCSGRKYNSQYVLTTLVTFLCSNDGPQLAGLARTLQQSMGSQATDSLQRVDDFVEKLIGAGYLFQSRNSGSHSGAFTSAFQPAPTFIPPATPAQGGAELSDLNTALDATSGVAHSSTPFADVKA